MAIPVAQSGAAPMAHTISDARHKPLDHQHPADDVGRFGRGLGFGISLSIALWLALGVTFSLWWS